MSAAKSDATAITLAGFEPRHTAVALTLWERTAGVGLSGADEPQALAAFLSRNPGLSFVAEEAGQLVGTILCGHDGRRGFIYHLVVAEGHRRRGIGRCLLRRGLLALDEAGIQKCHVMVFKSNGPGLAFWRAVGGEERVTLSLFSLSPEDGL
jgi:ribosomal protein S18 acetylase RimI-like enzyme